MNKVERMERTMVKPDVPHIVIGGLIRVHLRVVEGEKERIQVYEGIVIGKRGVRHRTMITVRKISHGVGVERIFPLHSPFIQKIEILQEGDVHRAKLYYLRGRIGRSARVAEKKRVPPLKSSSTPREEVPSGEPDAVASGVASDVAVNDVAAENASA